MTNKEKIEKALAELPNSADGIAQFLHDEAIKGCRGDSELCPLANYLRKVSGAKTLAAYHSAIYSGGVLVAQLSLEQSRFISRFDTNWYPQLIQK